MEKKPVYESPKVSSLDEKESLSGQGIYCGTGSGNQNCESGNVAGQCTSVGSGVFG